MSEYKNKFMTIKISSEQKIYNFMTLTHKKQLKTIKID